jgi:hypothetical protein
MAQTRDNAPPTAIPATRNGSYSSETIGYRTSAASASGQQSTNRMQNSTNFSIILPYD